MSDQQRADLLVRQIEAEVDALMTDPVRLAQEVPPVTRYAELRPNDAFCAPPIHLGPSRASVARAVAARMCGRDVDYDVAEGIDGSAHVVIGAFRR